MNDFLPTIGIECHVQLKTRTKLFAAVGNDAREAPPNTLISHICLGMPGALPVLNRAAVELASRAAFALNTRPQTFSSFDRKHYFYPDLPKGYQISQLYHPIIIGGHVDIVVDGETQRVGITRAHLEEDAGKNTHPPGAEYSLVDLNRAGTPLLEIVSEPDIHSAAAAKAYAHELYLLMKHADVSEADLYYGNMRFDVNVSVSNDPNTLGNRTETKNLNSFKAVEKAVEYEIARQTKILQNGDRVTQETRGWDDAKQQTFSQRSKEDSHDYRYMPDPDIPPVVLDQAYIDAVAQTLLPSPGDIRGALESLQLDSSAVETIVENVRLGRLILEISANAKPDDVRRVTLWLVGELQALLVGENANIDELKLNQADLLALSTMVAQNLISSTGAKTVFATMIRTGEQPQAIAEAQDLLQVSDSGELETIVDQVIADNEQAADDVRNGEMKAIGFLVGQVMKLSRGKANPPMVQELLKKKLGG